jgi:hypothetical protein
MAPAKTRLRVLRGLARDGERDRQGRNEPTTPKNPSWRLAPVWRLVRRSFIPFSLSPPPPPPPPSTPSRPLPPPARESRLIHIWIFSIHPLYTSRIVLLHSFCPFRLVVVVVVPFPFLLMLWFEARAPTSTLFRSL